MSAENYHFSPSETFARQAIAQASLYAEAKADRLGFWAKQANRHTGTPASRHTGELPTTAKYGPFIMIPSMGSWLSWQGCR